MAIDAPPRPPDASRIAAVGKAVTGRAAGAGDAVLTVFDTFYDQLKFYGRILRALPRALRYPKEIAVLMSDITLGSGAAMATRSISVRRPRSK